jgi:hypothetical protein
MRILKYSGPGPAVRTSTWRVLELAWPVREEVTGLSFHSEDTYLSFLVVYMLV